jgi:hypothetical protein
MADRSFEVRNGSTVLAYADEFGVHVAHGHDASSIILALRSVGEMRLASGDEDEPGVGIVLRLPEASLSLTGDYAVRGNTIAFLGGAG